MPDMTCDAIGCPNPIMRRCSICQGSYCLRHQAQGNKRCDACIAEKKRTGGSLMKWGCLMSVVGFLLTIVLMGSLGYESGNGGGIIVVIGGVVFLIGAQISGTSKG